MEAVKLRSLRRGFTLMELMMVVTGFMVITAMVTGLYGGIRPAFPTVATDLVDVSTAIHRYGHAHRWYWGSGRATASASPAASADIIGRQGALNYCGLILSPPVPANVDDNDGPRTRKISGVFMMNKQSLIDGDFIPAGLDADWGYDMDVEYRPGGDPTQGARLKALHQSHLTAGETLLTTSANAGSIEEFRRLCSKPPREDVIVIKLRHNNIDRLRALQNFLTNQFEEPVICQRMTVDELDVANLTLPILVRPNSVDGQNC